MRNRRRLCYSAPMRIHRMTSIALLTTLMAGGAGCGRQPGGKALAVVNGQPITEQDVTERLAKLSPAYRQALGNDRHRLLEEMVLEVLLLQEASRRGLDRDQEVRRLLLEARKQIIFELQRYVPEQQYYVYANSIMITGTWQPYVKNYGPNTTFDYGSRVAALWLER